MKITEALLAEHVVFHGIFDHLERATPRARSLPTVQALAALLESMLGAHSKVEDDLLIEPLEHCIDHIGQRETFHHEHDAIEKSLEHVRNAKDLKRAKKFLLTAVLLAREHFDKEERLVFPLAEERLNPRTLAYLGGQWQERRR